MKPEYISIEARRGRLSMRLMIRVGISEMTRLCPGMAGMPHEPSDTIYMVVDGALDEQQDWYVATR